MNALFSNTTGTFNTATGAGALQFDTTGTENTATGAFALQLNHTGDNNTATGVEALLYNSTGEDNTATGVDALYSNTTGNANTAAGLEALSHNTSGDNNTATGLQTLRNNTTSADNTASGAFALLSNTTGGDNTATGSGALENNTTGSSNIAVGSSAGFSLTTGSNNIEIGNVGVAGESNTIRIGTSATQTSTFVAGISNSPVKGKAVFVGPNGKLGFKASSARFKRDIHYMDQASAKLMKLRPVTFRYKADPEATLQYGLVAEEVQPVYPELVTYGADGKVDTVLYDQLPAMLLNEVQKQARENQQQAKQIATLTAQAERKDDQIASQRKQIDELKKKDAQIDALAERMNALERQVRLARPGHLVSAMR